MKHIIHIATSLLLLFPPACQDRKEENMAKLVQEWQGKEIRFPEKVTFTRYVTDTIDYQIPASDYKIFVYVDSIGCTSCKLQLPKWRELITHIDSITSTNIPFLFFFQAKDERELRYLLKRDKFDLPVCIDRENALERLNHFPKDITFQTFLLDKENRVVVIGNPVHNLAVRDLYIKQITGNPYQETSAITTLQAEQTEFDWGTIPLGSKQEKRIKIRNTGQTTFHLKGFTTSCDCTEATSDWNELAPGEAGEILVTYKAEQAGDFLRTVDIYGNLAEKALRINFIGVVDHKREAIDTY